MRPSRAARAHDVVPGAAAGVVMLRHLDHQPVRHSVMGTVVITVARVVALPELDQGPSQGLPAIILFVGSGMDDDQVEIGLLVPAAGGPGAEEDDGLRVSVRHQFPAEIKSGRTGTRVDHGRQLIADAVSSHWRHGMVSGRPARRRQWTWWWSTTLVTGGLRSRNSGGDSGG